MIKLFKDKIFLNQFITNILIICVTFFTTALVLFMIVKRNSESRNSYDVLAALLILLTILIVFGIYMAFLSFKKIMQPIHTLIEATEKISKEDFKEPISIKTNTELDCIIKNFNHMQAVLSVREHALSQKNEELKEQTRQALEASKLKSQFLANMSHELRTPLNSIIGFTTRVIKKGGQYLPPLHLENLNIVKKEAQHLLSLINDLLDYSKIEAGKMEIHIEEFNLVDVIEEVNGMVRSLMEGKPLRYRQKLISNNNIPMQSDRIKVKQILINLLSNAIKYSEKGTIRLIVDQVEHSYRICVQDEGIGISSDNINEIFEEFRQIDGSFTRKVGGTGLGLSITKHYVESLGGQIQVASAPGLGSYFSVFLPMKYSDENTLK